MNKKLVFFVEPLNALTNYIIAENLKTLGDTTEDNFFVHKDTAGAHPRWECPYRLVSTLVEECTKNPSIKFKIWIKSGKNFKRGEFFFKKKKRKNLKLKKPAKI